MNQPIELCYCKCDSENGQWLYGCECWCHYRQMDAHPLYGPRNWCDRDLKRMSREKDREDSFQLKKPERNLNDGKSTENQSSQCFLR